MKFKKIILITLLLLAFLTISSVSANDNLTDEGVLQDTSSEQLELSEDNIISSSEDEIISAKDDGTFTALQNKINNAASGSTITLENDYSYDSDDNNLRGGVLITKAITIDGQGHTINAKKSSRIFYVENNNGVLLKNINFINGICVDFYHRDIPYRGIPLYGGAIYGDCRIVNCTFINNTATNGGAINAGNCSIINCTFINNTNNNIFTRTTKDTIFEANKSITRQVVDFFGGERGELFNVTLTDIDGNPLSDKRVIFIINDIRYYMHTDEQGIVGLPINLYYETTLTYEYTFVGDDDYNPSSASTIVTITKKPTNNDQNHTSKITNKPKKTTPKFTAKKATFKAKIKTKKYTVTLNAGKKAVKKVKLYLKVNGKTITAKTNSKGKATFNIKNLKKKGTYKTTISFKGNNNYNKVTKTVKIKVK